MAEVALVISILSVLIAGGTLIYTRRADLRAERADKRAEDADRRAAAADERAAAADERSKQAALPRVEAVVAERTRYGPMIIPGPPALEWSEVEATITNTGSVPAGITAIGFLTNTGRRYPFEHGDASSLPKTLEPAQHITATTDKQAVERDMHAEGDWVVALYVEAAGGHAWRVGEVGPFIDLGKPDA